jgi:hypothetical protein
VAPVERHGAAAPWRSSRSSAVAAEARLPRRGPGTSAAGPGSGEGAADRATSAPAWSAAAAHTSRCGERRGKQHEPSGAFDGERTARPPGRAWPGRDPSVGERGCEEGKRWSGFQGVGRECGPVGCIGFASGGVAGRLGPPATVRCADPMLSGRTGRTAPHRPLGVLKPPSSDLLRGAGFVEERRSRPALPERVSAEHMARHLGAYVGPGPSEIGASAERAGCVACGELCA